MPILGNYMGVGKLMEHTSRSLVLGDKIPCCTRFLGLLCTIVQLSCALSTLWCSYCPGLLVHLCRVQLLVLFSSLAVRPLVCQLCINRGYFIAHSLLASLLCIISFVNFCRFVLSPFFVNSPNSLGGLSGVASLVQYAAFSSAVPLVRDTQLQS